MLKLETIKVLLVGKKINRGKDKHKNTTSMYVSPCLTS